MPANFSYLLFAPAMVVGGQKEVVVCSQACTTQSTAGGMVLLFPPTAGSGSIGTAIVFGDRLSLCPECASRYAVVNGKLQVELRGTVTGLKDPLAP